MGMGGALTALKGGYRDVQGPLYGALFLVLLGFPSFLFSFYAKGMALRAEWRLLRAPASYLLVNVLAMGVVIAGLLASSFGYSKADLAMFIVLAAAQTVLAGELLLNFVMDLFRPRLPGQEQRPSFDSRLCSLVAYPERVGHSIAESLNYQFGFEVSGTWFYRLLSRALLPLLLFGAVVLLAMSSIVIVDEGQRAIVLRWGRVRQDWRNAPIEQTTWGPGLHFKLPWPVDRAYKYSMDEVRQLKLGVGADREPYTVNGKAQFLWTQEHGWQQEKDFIIAIQPSELHATGAGRPPAVNIIKLVVAVQYVLEDPYEYTYGYVNPDKALECLAYREMTRYCASATLDEKIVGEGAEQRPEAILSFGRGKASLELHRRIQSAADAANLGVRVTYVGIVSAHPPADAAPAFEEVLKAERGREVSVYRAEAEANKRLATVAGAPLKARRLALAIRKHSDLALLNRLAGDRGAFEQKLDEFRRLAEGRLERNAEMQRRAAMRGLEQEGESIDLRELAKEEQAYLDLLERVRKEHAAAVEAGDAFDLAPLVVEAEAESFDRLADSGGEAASRIWEASARRWRIELNERAKTVAFPRELLAYRASPRVYLLDRYLSVWDEVLPDMRKYVLGIDPNRLELRLNWEKEPGYMQQATFGEGQ